MYNLIILFILYKNNSAISFFLNASQIINDKYKISYT